MNQARPLPEIRIDLIDATDKKSWDLIFSDRIFSQEASMEYFKDEAFLKYVVGRKREDQDPFNYYVSLVKEKLCFLHEFILVLYLAVNNSTDKGILEMFEKLTISSKALEEKPSKSKNISKKNYQS